METYTLAPAVNPFAVNNNNNKVVTHDISLFLLRVKLAITYSNFLLPRTGLFCNKTNNECSSLVSKYLKSINAELPCKSL
jgi:hypothetical protein